MHCYRDIALDTSNVAIFGYLSCELRLTPDGGRGFTWDDLRNILHGGQRWLGYKMAYRHCRKFQSAEEGARALQTTDRQQTELRRQIPERNVRLKLEIYQ